MIDAISIVGICNGHVCMKPNGSDSGRFVLTSTCDVPEQMYEIGELSPKIRKKYPLDEQHGHERGLSQLFAKIATKKCLVSSQHMWNYSPFWILR